MSAACLVPARLSGGWRRLEAGSANTFHKPDAFVVILRITATEGSSDLSSVSFLAAALAASPG
jgi:hypothetical protein